MILAAAVSFSVNVFFMFLLLSCRALARFRESWYNINGSLSWLPAVSCVLGRRMDAAFYLIGWMPKESWLLYVQMLTIHARGRRCRCRSIQAQFAKAPDCPGSRGFFSSGLCPGVPDLFAKPDFCEVFRHCRPNCRGCLLRLSNSKVLLVLILEYHNNKQA